MSQMQLIRLSIVWGKVNRFRLIDDPATEATDPEHLPACRIIVIDMTEAASDRPSVASQEEPQSVTTKPPNRALGGRWFI
jgi:hypothetical protein